MKQKVLEMLKEFMMGEEGSKFKPKAIEVEMVGEPKEVKGKEGLKELLEDASEANPVEDEDYEEGDVDRAHDKYGAEEAGVSEDEFEGSEEDEEGDEKAKKMSLQDFLASRSK